MPSGAWADARHVGVMGRRGRRRSQGEGHAPAWRSTGEVGETQTEVWAEVGKPPCMVVGLDVTPNVAIRVRPPGSAGALAGRVSLIACGCDRPRLSLYRQARPDIPRNGACWARRGRRRSQVGIRGTLPASKASRQHFPRRTGCDWHFPVRSVRLTDFGGHRRFARAETLMVRGHPCPQQRRHCSNTQDGRVVVRVFRSVRFG